MEKHVYTETIVDSDGEFVQRKWITKKAQNTQHFIKMYLEDLKLLNKLSFSDFRVLHSLVTYLEYNTNQFFLNKERRAELAQTCTITSNTLNTCISRLCKKNLLIRVSNSTYQMNPKIFFNGEELQRAKVLELKIRYEICPDC